MWPPPPAALKGAAPATPKSTPATMHVWMARGVQVVEAGSGLDSNAVMCTAFDAATWPLAQIIRAILLARATAASLRGLRSSNCNSHAEADLLPGLAKRMTDVA